MRLQDTWRKNWPEVRGTLVRALPQFVFASSPRDLGDAVPAFCYHVVEHDEFEADLDFLVRNGYTTIDADGLLDHIENRRPAPPRSVVLSFDDGATNLFNIVFPLLEQYQQRAVAFVAPWFHCHAGGRQQGDGPGAGQRPCTWAQIQKMHESGLIDFQSHTFDHRYVPRWPEACDLTGVSEHWVRRVRGPGLELSDDLRLARLMLERRLGKAVRHLAFPRFDGTSYAIRAGRARGYRGFWWGVLSGVRINRPGQSPTRIARINGDLLRRLPGSGRVSLRSVLFRRYRGPRQPQHRQPVALT